MKDYSPIPKSESTMVTNWGLDSVCNVCSLTLNYRSCGIFLPLRGRWITLQGTEKVWGSLWVQRTRSNRPLIPSWPHYKARGWSRWYRTRKVCHDGSCGFTSQLERQQSIQRQLWEQRSHQVSKDIIAWTRLQRSFAWVRRLETRICRRYDQNTPALGKGESYEEGQRAIGLANPSWRKVNTARTFLWWATKASKR